MPTMEAFLSEVPDYLKPLYKKHWHTIRESSKKGILKDVYHYPLAKGTDKEILNKLNETLANYKNGIKINCAFGFALRKRETDDLRFYHPSNNNMMFETARFVKSIKDRNNLKKDLEKADGFEYARQHRPSTEWIVDSLMCVRFDIFKL